MMIEGSYDDVFDGCEAVFHVAGNFGTDRRWLDATSVPGRAPPIDEVMGEAVAAAASTSAMTKSYDQGVYDSYTVSMKLILDSIARSKTVKRCFHDGCWIFVQKWTTTTTFDGVPMEGQGWVRKAHLFYNSMALSVCWLMSSGRSRHDIRTVNANVRLRPDMNCGTATWIRPSYVPAQYIQNGARYFNGATDQDELTTTGIITLLRELFPEQANQIASSQHEDGDVELSSPRR
jgi:hypothetical protein